MRNQIKTEKGRIYLTACGTYMAYRYYGKQRHRKCFKTMADAEKWLSDFSFTPLSMSQYEEAQIALSMLPKGVSLLAVCKEYIERNDLEKKASMPIINAVEMFLADRKIDLSEETIKTYRTKLTRFAKINSTVKMAAVSSSHIESYVAGAKNTTRNNILRHLSAFFSWAKENDLIAANPCEKVRKARVVATEIKILSVADAETILRQAEETDPQLIPYLVIGMFAGVRPKELQRLRPENISGDYITLSAAQTKTADARTIPIRKNLAAWLSKYPLSKYPITDAIETRRKRMMKKIPSVVWSNDCMRHSFASYAYEESKDAALVASEMGHVGTAVFFRHYRALAMPGSGGKFFSIFPKPG